MLFNPVLRLDAWLAVTSLFAIIVESKPEPVCMPAYQATYTSMGCYTDNDTRTLSGAEYVLAGNTPQDCANSCGLGGYTYAGTEYST